MKYLSRGIVVFNRVDQRIIVFLVLSLFFLGFSLNYNEEQYFAYARAFMDRNWMPGSFLFTDFPGSRLIFQYITGFALRFISFEQLAFWGRLFIFILFAFPVAALARLLRLNNVLLVFWLTIMYIPQQNFFGGEWIFGGFESKTLAYLFILWSLYFLLADKLLKSIIFAALATYWHFLAAGWYGMYLFIYIVLYRFKADKRVTYYWILYALIQVPLVIYLFTGLVENKHTVIDGINTNYIYTYIRNPHHIGIFRSLDYFYHYHFYKVVMACIALSLGLTVFRRLQVGLTVKMNRFMIIILVQLLVFVPVAYFDRNGFLMKFYPFRGSVLAMMLFQLILVIFLRDRWVPAIRKSVFPSTGKKRFYIFQMVFLLVVTLASLGLKGIDRVEKYGEDKSERADIDNLASAMKNLTNPGDRFLFLCREDRYNLALPRKSERDAFFYKKYIPTTSRGIYEWYQRYLWQQKLLGDPGLIPAFEKNHHVRYIVSCKALQNSHLKQVFANRRYHLYRYID